MVSKSAKTKLYTFAKMAIDMYGSCPPGVIYDFIFARPKNRYWLPRKRTIGTLLRANPEFYKDPNGEWCYRTLPS